MAAPRAAMAAVFLDAATSATAPLLLVPHCSQNHGYRQPRATPSGRIYVIRKIDRSTLSQLVVDEGGLARSVALLHTATVSHPPSQVAYCCSVQGATLPHCHTATLVAPWTSLALCLSSALDAAVVRARQLE